MARVRLTADVEPELRRRVKVAAASSDKSVSEWIVQAIRDTLENERGGMYLPPAGAKPKGSKNPPRLRDGSKISDAVVEDRR